jgi:hypothetical protein
VARTASYVRMRWGETVVGRSPRAEAGRPWGERCEVSLIDPEILKAIADKALRRRPEQRDRALADVEPGGRCAGGDAGPCSRPAAFTVTTPTGGRYECCRDHLLAFARDQGGSEQGLLTSSRPPQG